MYYKILIIKTKKPITYVWVGSNKNGEITKSTIKELNGILEINKCKLVFK